MFIKEIKDMIKKPAYYVVMILPLIITFIMSEGTKEYLQRFASRTYDPFNVAKEVVMYRGTILNSKIQFAVSELNFMLMICAILAGLSIFHERKFHIWDRIVSKRELIFAKFLIHYVFTALMSIFNLAIFYFCFDIKIPLTSIYVFLTVPIISIFFGIFVGFYVESKVILFNGILMLVMAMGFFGGALSLTSVLSTTKFMNVLMYLSPLTMANKLVFQDIIHVDMTSGLFIWAGMVLGFSAIFLFFIERRVKNGASL